ncbi:acetyl-CoA carboxylase biotin carboxyl carrier protein subunit [Corynebacterium aquilae]|uniref:Acetyl-COA carboxylase n=1 Tax=Corynebacterium aquilae DSM 44791 TaxID=1431546 RepID=A0A1L7CFP4_9CORY|nr:biotin/lipoyl-containing protein [Corynebacterium aquilae]APT84646.1 acetyl-COA carboxylase [Corynebacterium aquilae DSM 44791]
MRICAPFAGIVHYVAAEGQRVDTGDVVAMVETIKLEASLQAPGPGIVASLNHEDFSDVEGGDILLEITSE